METKKDHTWFWIITGLIVALIIIFIAQNHQPVRIRFLIIDISGAGFLVFLVVFFLGFFGGMGWENFRKIRKENKRIHRGNEDVNHQGH